MDKVDVQLSIWNGSRWLEISNQRTINTINENQHAVADEVAEAQKGIAKAIQDAQKAVDSADKAIEQAGFANDTATTAKEVAENTAKDATQAKEDSATALTNAKDALEKAQQAIEDIANGKTDISALQTTVDDINTSLDSVSSDLDTAKGNLDKVAQQAKTNGESIVSINKDVDGIKTDVADTQGNVTQVVQQAKELSTAITNAKGDISTLQQTATQLSSSIKDNTDNISSVKQTATKLSSDMKDAQGNISSLQQSATDLSSTIGTIQKDLSDTQKTVSSQGTQITQNAKDITSKANKSDLDATNKRMTTAETSIKQNAKDIESKASQSDVNTLTGRVSTAESNITQNANSIKSKVSSSDVQGILDNGGYATQTWTGSQIDQSADEISKTVTEVSNKVDGLSYDNRNLIIANDLVNGWIDDLGDPSGVGDTTFTTGVIATGSNQGITITKAGKVVIIGEYDTDKKFITKNRIENPDMYYQFKTGKETEYIRVTFGFSKKDYGTPYKIEKGNVATDWSPAPEDMATVTALSKVDQKADSISTTVTNNKTDADSKFTNINQTINGIQSTVANKADSSTVTQLSDVVDSKVSTKDYNSEITQLADDINLRVTKDGLISQINQQAGGNTLIQVSGGKGKLYLDADSTVFSRKAFIPSAAISSLNADKINAGTIKGIDISGVTIEGSTIKSANDINDTLVSIVNGSVVFYSNYKSDDDFELIGNIGADIQNAHNRFIIDAPQMALGSFDGRGSLATGLEIDSGDMYTHFGTMVNQGSGGVFRVNDKNNANTFAVETNGSGKVWFGKAYSDGGGSLYSADNDGWWMRNHDGSYGNVNAKAFIQKSSIDLKKNIEMADTDKLANDIYNMDVTTWNYKEETSQNSKHIGAVIGGDYHINSCLLSDDKAGVNTTSLTFALVATVQKQAKQISELMATVEALKIKNGD
jgi:predicted  nucleic acid-binding Zn-ribbon protein